jgi:hypothetical protein
MRPHRSAANAIVLHTTAGETKPVLRLDAAREECVHERRRHGKIWTDIGNLAGSDDHAKKDSSFIGRSARTSGFAVDTKYAHRVIPGDLGPP